MIQSLHSKNSHSLKNKLIRAQVVTVFSVILLSSIVFIVNEYIGSKKYLESRVKGVANVLAHNLSAAVNFGDNDEAFRVLESIKSEKDISFAAVFNKNKKELVRLLARGERPIEILKELNFSTNSLQRDRHFALTSQIKEGDELLGYLVLVVDLDYYIQKLKNYIFTIFIVLVLSFIIILIVANVLQSRITKPINSILNVIDTIKKERAYSYRIETENDEMKVKEFSELCSSFNEMLYLIESRNDEIQSINENLENLIEKKSQELEQERALKIQAGKLSSLGEMAGGIAHEINNPLTIITGKLSQITRHMDKEGAKDEFVENRISTIKSVVSRIVKIVKGLQSFSRDASDDPMEVVDLYSIVEETMPFCEKRFENSRVRLTINPFGGEDILKVRCRSVQISQVLLNLLNNSFDAIEHKQVPWIEISFKRLDRKVQLIVTDSGNGIGLDIQDKILNPFFTTKPIGKGTGLGLSVSKGILDAHNGNIFVDNNNPNTSFVIELPLWEKES